MYKAAPVIILGSFFFFSCGHRQPPAPSDVPVNLYTVTAQHVVYYDRYPGTTAALSQVNLLPQVQGYVTGIYFKEGAHVRKGQLLYEIDKRTYEANYNAAMDNLKVAQGNLKQAQQDESRYAYLNANKAVAKQLYDHAVITLQNTKSQVRAAIESVRTTKINLAFSSIVAPFDGTIGFSQVKLGNLVTVGQTVLNTISTDNPMGVDFLINEKQLNYYEDLQNGKAKSIDSLFTLILPNGNFYPQLGEISVIDRAVDPQTGSIRIRLVFPNANYSLRAGMSCVVRVHNQDSTPQLVVPNKAVIEQMGEFFVYVAKDTTMPASGADTTSGKHKHENMHQGLFAMQRKVMPGETVGANIIIKSGIKEGDQIVVDGVQSLHDGAAITTANKRPPAQGGKGGR
jgi:membrane fusion protein (multidrug efflux system)